MNLLIISHTSHQIHNGAVCGFGPTVREINYLATLFDSVIHIAPLHLEERALSSIPYVRNVEFIPIEYEGGKGLFDKVKVFFNGIVAISTVHKQLKRIDYFQFRGPTGIGLFLIPYLIFSKKHGWFKYAGNWVDKSKPLSYSIQKFMLQLQRKRKVTINGHWPGQRPNILSFENPCLTDHELQYGAAISMNKRFDQDLVLLFVGRVDHRKGIDKLIAMLNIISSSKDIVKLIVVGDGEIDNYRGKNKSDIEITFTGGLSREEINLYYERSHILILPSLSEGFPKVVAEAAAFGCVPAVTSISSLSQYIGSNNGLLFSSFDPFLMAKELQQLIMSRSDLKRKSMEATKLASRFTYTYYLQRIQLELLT